MEEACSEERSVMVGLCRRRAAGRRRVAKSIMRSEGPCSGRSATYRGGSVSEEPCIG